MSYFFNQFIQTHWYNIIGIVGLVLLAIITILVFLLITNIEQVKKLKSERDKLMRSFDALDEQAKLIVKTDLELNKAQEQLDKRLSSLDSLEKVSRFISTTLDEEEIFSRLNQQLLTGLGFEKNLILMFDQDKKLRCRISLGFSNQELQFILSQIQKESHLMDELAKGNTFSSAKTPKQKKNLIAELFNTDHFTLSPILTKNGMIGLIFVGNRSEAFGVTEGDEELLSILANQIGQSIENARLFEQVFKSSQSLETKVQERTKQLQKVLEEVKKISKNKSEFISAVSHELRTPLTSIKGYASLLMTGKMGEIPEGVKERLAKIDKHSDNLVNLINNLLDISRIESGRTEMNLTKHNIKNIVDNVHDLLTPQINEKNIHWNVKIQNALPEVLIDHNQIERVFINLIGNAIKFTPKNGTITIEATTNQGIVTVKISDTGIGIKEDDLSKLFNEFYRAENEINQTVKGTGLGLALARHVIEAHGGKIWVSSQFGKGATFYFTIPINQKIKPAEEASI